jgi:hypothetical protein
VRLGEGKELQCITYLGGSLIRNRLFDKATNHRNIEHLIIEVDVDSGEEGEMKFVRCGGLGNARGGTRVVRQDDPAVPCSCIARDHGSHNLESAMIYILCFSFFAA